MARARSLRRLHRPTLAMIAAGSFLLGGTVVAGPAHADVPPWMNTYLTANQRAKLLLAAMTFDEKITLETATGAFQRWSTNPIPRLGIPGIDNTDSGLGVRNSGSSGATSFPSGLAQAAAFDAAQVGAQGKQVGKEAWLKGHNELLGPQIDMARVANSGRMFETYGEDPTLTKSLGSANVAGLQSNPVMALVKHWTGYTQEIDRTLNNSAIDERTLREIYVRPWEGVVNAGAAAAMCTYPKVNGQYNCDNKHLLTDILKEDLGFKGFVQSDFAATHSTEAANAGQDVEGPYATYFGEQLRAAVLNGTVPMSRLDDMVVRQLRQYFAKGLFDHPAPRIFENDTTRDPLPFKVANAGDRLATKMGEDGAVLLKNKRNILPLNPKTTKAIAVIGADADWNIQGSGSGSVVPPTTYTSILDGISQRTNAKVEWVAGTDPVTTGDLLTGSRPVPSSVLTAGATPGQAGLTGQFWTNSSFAGEPNHTLVVSQVDNDLGLVNLLGTGVSQVPTLPSDVSQVPMSARWTSTLTPPSTGSYTFSVNHWGSTRLVVDGQEIINAAGPNQNTINSGTVTLTAGKPVSVLMEYRADEPSAFQFFGGGQVRLDWTPPVASTNPSIDAAVAAATRNQYVVIVARDYNSEGNDRGSLNLPQDQDRLISAVSAVNPNTIVVLATGGPVLMPWLDSVPGVLEAWYPGQQQGKVVARLLFGDVSPSGKLPISFPRSQTDQPISTQAQWPGIDKTSTFTEGVFMGYRGYQQKNISPLFPFGFGLSYTSFSFDNLRTTAVTVGKNDPAEAKFRVTNTGGVAGTAIAQVYVGKLPTKAVQTPKKQLAGWSKVSLSPGERSIVTVTLDQEAMSYFDVGTDAWVMPRGDLAVYVGASSEEAQLVGNIHIN